MGEWVFCTKNNKMPSFLLIHFDSQKMKWIFFVLTTGIVLQYTEEANKNHAHHKEEKPADCVDQGEEINLDNLDTTIR